MTRRLARRLFATTALGAAVCAHGPGVAQVLPTGGVTAAGVVKRTSGGSGDGLAAGSAFTTNASTTQLSLDVATPSAVVRWDSFNIGAGKTLNFTGAAAFTVLNVVTGAETSGGSGAPTQSTISGTLNGGGTGSVWLINPAGILSNGGQFINLGSLVLSTLPLTSIDGTAFDATVNPALFTGPAAGGTAYRFATAGTGSALTIQSGSAITTSGNVVLVGPRADLAGTVSAGGDVALALAANATLTLKPGSLVGIALNAGTSVDATNTVAGSINGQHVTLAALSQTDLTHTLLSVAGAVTATTATATDNGIVLSAGANAGGVTVAGTIKPSELTVTGTLTATQGAQAVLAANDTLTLSGTAPLFTGTGTLTGTAAKSIGLSGSGQLSSAGDVTLTAGGAAAGTLALSGAHTSAGAVTLTAVSPVAGINLTVTGSLAADKALSVTGDGGISIGAGSVMRGDATGQLSGAAGLTLAAQFGAITADATSLIAAGKLTGVVEGHQSAIVVGALDATKTLALGNVEAAALKRKDLTHDIDIDGSITTRQINTTASLSLNSRNGDLSVTGATSIAGGVQLSTSGGATPGNVTAGSLFSAATFDVVINAAKVATVSGAVGSGGNYTVGAGTGVVLGAAGTTVAQQAARTVTITTAAGDIAVPATAGVTLTSNTAAGNAATDGALTLTATNGSVFGAGAGNGTLTLVTGPVTLLPGAATADREVVVKTGVTGTVLLGDVTGLRIGSASGASQPLTAAGIITLGKVKLDEALSAISASGDVHIATGSTAAAISATANSLGSTAEILGSTARTGSLVATALLGTATATGTATLLYIEARGGPSATASGNAGGHISAGASGGASASGTADTDYISATGNTAFANGDAGTYIHAYGVVTATASGTTLRKPSGTDIVARATIGDATVGGTANRDIIGSAPGGTLTFTASTALRSIIGTGVTVTSAATTLTAGDDIVLAATQGVTPGPLVYAASSVADTPTAPLDAFGGAVLDPTLAVPAALPILTGHNIVVLGGVDTVVVNDITTPGNLRLGARNDLRLGVAAQTVALTAGGSVRLEAARRLTGVGTLKVRSDSDGAGAEPIVLAAGTFAPVTGRSIDLAASTTLTAGPATSTESAADVFVVSGANASGLTLGDVNAHALLSGLSAATAAFADGSLRVTGAIDAHDLRLVQRFDLQASGAVTLNSVEVAGRATTPRSAGLTAAVRDDLLVTAPSLTIADHADAFAADGGETAGGGDLRLTATGASATALLVTDTADLRARRDATLTAATADVRAARVWAGRAIALTGTGVSDAADLIAGDTVAVTASAGPATVNSAVTAAHLVDAQLSAFSGATTGTTHAITVNATASATRRGDATLTNGITAIDVTPGHESSFSTIVVAATGGNAVAGLPAGTTVDANDILVTATGTSAFGVVSATATQATARTGDLFALASSTFGAADANVAQGSAGRDIIAEASRDASAQGGATRYIFAGAARDASATGGAGSIVAFAGRDATASGTADFDIIANAGHDARATALGTGAGRDLVASANSGDATLKGKAGRDALATAFGGTAVLNGVTANRDVTAVARTVNASGGALVAGDDIVLMATAGDVTAVDMASGAVAIDSEAPNDLTVPMRRVVDVATPPEATVTVSAAAAGGDFLNVPTHLVAYPDPLGAGGTIAALSLPTDRIGQNIVVRASGAATLAGPVSAGRDFRVAAGGTITLGAAATTTAQSAGSRVLVESRRADIALAGTLALTSNAGRQLTGGAADLDLAAATGIAGPDVTLTASRQAGGAQAGLGSIVLTSAANSIVLDSSAANAAVVDGGPASISAPGTIDVRRIRAGGTVSLQGTTAIVGANDTALIKPVSIVLDDRDASNYVAQPVRLSAGAGATLTALGFAGLAAASSVDVLADTGVTMLGRTPVTAASAFTAAPLALDDGKVRIAALTVESQTGAASITTADGGTTTAGATTIAIRGRQTGSSASATTLHATADITVSGPTAMVATAVSDAGSITVAGQSLAKLTSGSAAGDILVGADGAATLGSGSAGHSVVVSGATAAVTTSATTGDDLLVIAAGGDATVANATLTTLAGSFDAQANDAATASRTAVVATTVASGYAVPYHSSLGSVSAVAADPLTLLPLKQLRGSNIDVIATGDVAASGSTMVAARDLRIEAGGSATLSTLSAGRDLFALAGYRGPGTLTFGKAATAGDDLIAVAMKGSVDASAITLTARGGPDSENVSDTAAGVLADGVTPLLDPLTSKAVSLLGGSNIDVIARGDVIGTGGGIDAARDLRIEAGGSATLSALSAGRDLFALAGYRGPGTLKFEKAATAGDDLIAVALSGTVDASAITLTARGGPDSENVSDTAAGVLADGVTPLLDPLTSKAVSLLGGSNIDVIARGDVIGTGGGIDAARDLRIEAGGSATLSALSAGRDLFAISGYLGPGTLTFAKAATAGDDLIAVAMNGSVDASAITLTARGGPDSEGTSDTATGVLADGVTPLLDPLTGKALSLLAGSNIDVLATGNVVGNGGTIDAARDLRVEAGGAVSLATLKAGRDLVALAGYTRAGDLTIVNAATAGDDLVAVALQGSVNAASATLKSGGGSDSDSVTLDSAAALLADGVAQVADPSRANPGAGGVVGRLFGSNIVVAASGDATVSSASADRDARIGAGGNATLITGDAGRDLLVLARTGTATGGSLTAKDDVALVAIRGAATLTTAKTTGTVPDAGDTLLDLSGAKVRLDGDPLVIARQDAASITVAAGGLARITDAVTSAGRLTIDGRTGVDLGQDGVAVAATAARDIQLTASLQPVDANIVLRGPFTLTSNSDGVGSGDGITFRLAQGGIAGSGATVTAMRSTALNLASQGVVAVTALKGDGSFDADPAVLPNAIRTTLGLGANAAITLATIDSATLTLTARDAIAIGTVIDNAGVTLTSSTGSVTLGTASQVDPGDPVKGVVLTDLEHDAIDIRLFGTTGASLGTTSGPGEALTRDVIVATDSGAAEVVTRATARDDIVVTSATDAATATLLVASTAGALDSENGVSQPFTGAGGRAFVDPAPVSGLASYTLADRAGANFIVAGKTGATLGTARTRSGMQDVRVVTAGGNATLGMTDAVNGKANQVLVISAAGDATATDTTDRRVQAAGDVVVIGGRTATITGTVNAGGSLIVNAGAVASVNVGTAGGDATVSGNSVAINSVTAGDDVVALATTTLTATTLLAGTGGDSERASDTQPLTVWNSATLARDPVGGGTVTGLAGNNIRLSAGGDATIASAMAARDVRLTSGANATIATAKATARDVAVTAAANATVATATAVRDVTVSAGAKANVGDATAKRNIVVTAGNDATVGRTNAANDITVRSQTNIFFTTLPQAPADASVPLAVAGGDILLNAPLSVTVPGSTKATGRYTVQSRDDVAAVQATGGSAGVIILGGNGAGVTQRSGSLISLSASDYQINSAMLLTGIDAAPTPRVQFDIAGGGSTIALGDFANANVTAATKLSNAEINTINAEKIEINADQTLPKGSTTPRTVLIGTLTVPNVRALASTTMATDFAVRGAGDIILSGLLTMPTVAGGPTRTLTLGGAVDGVYPPCDTYRACDSSVSPLPTTAVNGPGFTNNIARSIEAITTPDLNGVHANGGGIAAAGSDVRLRATYIALGEGPIATPGAEFLGKLLPTNEAPPTTEVVRTRFLVNAGSSFYIASPPYQRSATAPAVLVEAGNLKLSPGQWALIQNTDVRSQPGGGISVGGLQVYRVLGPNAADPVVGVFGKVAATDGVVASIKLIPDDLHGINPNNVRVNGCVALSTASCIVTGLNLAAIGVADPARNLLVRSLPALEVPFDLIGGTGNEALWRTDDDDSAAPGDSR